ncbi:MAG: hypothetical protein R2706_01870 [Acidimicrobiales bacterium]
MTDEPAHQYQVPDVDELLESAIAVVDAGRPLPMSSSVKVNRDELLDLLEAARDQLPEELRRARWLLKERDDFLAKLTRKRRNHRTGPHTHAGRPHGRATGNH